MWLFERRRRNYAGNILFQLSLREEDNLTIVKMLN